LADTASQGMPWSWANSGRDFEQANSPDAAG
jgi:hypothetical protein